MAVKCVCIFSFLPMPNELSILVAYTAEFSNQSFCATNTAENGVGEEEGRDLKNHRGPPSCLHLLTILINLKL